ncbi:cytochrome P450 [Streptomyces sp. NPDC000594]|uniref:cytochrome P450 family protein n=1 Tax=Streptomyces sp. NPDC000594 TaxID=3154261 RepID=UPI00331D3ED0
MTETSPPHPSALRLDPLVRDLDGETEHLRARGPFVRIDLMGVPAWTVTRHEQARQLLTDPRLVKDIDAWRLWRSGAVTWEWPLIGMVDTRTSLLGKDGPEHRRLRARMTQALTPRQLTEVRPVIQELIDGCLERTAGEAGPDGRVNLKETFAQPLPMGVVCALLGVDPGAIPHQLRLWRTFFSTQTSPDERRAVIGELEEIFTALVRERAARPAADLTSALLLPDGAGEPLTQEEATGNLQVLVAAGHESTVALLLSAVRALLTHPDQLRQVLDGRVPWEAVVEETLRWDPPTSHVLMRFATEDIDIDGFVIEEGEALAVSYRAIGRDRDRHGPGADSFDITRPAPARHLSFGHGPHLCPGAGLSRLEAAMALPALFERFPELALAVPAEEIGHLPVITQNDLASFPVLLYG